MSEREKDINSTVTIIRQILESGKREQLKELSVDLPAQASSSRISMKAKW